MWYRYPEFSIFGRDTDNPLPSGIFGTSALFLPLESFSMLFLIAPCLESHSRDSEDHTRIQLALIRIAADH